jgi:broad specificity phosphatase PhoE
MSRLVLVRHAQASFLEPNYDKLCANGQEQARLLGEFWVRRGVRFNSACSGPCVRHVHTARIVAECFRNAGREFPEMMVMSEFDEYPGDAVVKLGVAKLMEGPDSDEIRGFHRAFEQSSDSCARRRTFQKMFEVVVNKWVTGELPITGIESWPDFCARVERGLAKILNGTTSAGDVVVFTSGGPIGVAMRRALHLSQSDTLQMTWMSRNASFSEFLSSAERFTLSAFNAHPHLEDDTLLTYR